jgi:phage baseplate assembly protein W
MESFKLINGDLVMELGELVVVNGQEEIAQCVKNVLGTNKSEWFLNPNMGIKFNAFLEKNLNEEEMREQIRQGLFQEPRIKTVDKIAFDYDTKNRTMDVRFSATAVDGQKVEGEVIQDVG